MNLFKMAWEAWKGFSHYVAEFQSRFILAFFFYIILLPVGMVFWIRRLLLSVGSNPEPTSRWLTREHEEATLESAKQQF